MTAPPGTRYQAPSQEILRKRMEAADKPRQHLWIVTAAWRIPDPASMRDGQISLLDMENIIAFAGIGCFKCEKEYSGAMAKRPCLGSIDEVQP